MAVAAKKAAAGRTQTQEDKAEAVIIGREIQPPKNRAVALGRDGKPIWRRMRDDNGDQFHVDPALIPDGWCYEWKRESVYGWEDKQHQVKLNLNGWTPVPASRHDGLFMSPGHDGPIRREGMILMEIPQALKDEALREERKKANDQLRGSRSTGAIIGGATTSITDFENASARGSNFVRGERMPIQNDAKYEYVIDE